MKTAEKLTELIGRTPILRLNRFGKAYAPETEILAKLEWYNPAGSVKDRVARYLLEDAEEKGILKKDSVIIEPTSGNMGIGLAAVAAAKGYRAIIVMPDTMSQERQKLLKAYGAEIVLTEGAGGMDAAVAKARELAETIPHGFIPGQFTNSANPRAHYETTGPEIYLDTDGNVDILVAGVGSGGTISGAGKYLKERNPQIRVIAVEPKDSPLLSEGKVGSHGLQGLGAGFIPAVLDTEIYDEVVAVTTDQALDAANRLAKAEGVLAGISSGAALYAAEQIAKRTENRRKRIVVILPDGGDRYLSTRLFEEPRQEEFGFSTKCIYGKHEKFGGDLTGAISFPIYQSATFAHPEVGRSTGFDYSRLQNPTRAQVEKVVAALEGGVDALAFSTGMAAITALMELFHPGDHLITEADLYGGSIRLFHNVSEKNGIQFSHVNCSKENVESYVKENTKAIFIETPTNPMMNVTDIQKMAQIAKRHGLLLIVDNTFFTPYFQNPLSLGADVVIHSGTKFLGGHNDTLAGFLVTGSKEISEKMRFLIKTVGSGLAPFDSWLILRGIKTLPLRMEKAQENAKAIVGWLLGRPEVKKVYYPGIPGTEGHEVCKRQASGFGSMLTFELESRELALHVLKSTRLIPFAESLGGTETLLTYPVTQTHADVPEAERLANGITEQVLRLSVGIEDAKDLIADLEQAFATFR